MAKIIQESQRVSEKHYWLYYSDPDNPGSGWSFPCDESGGVTREDLTPTSLENFRKCLFGQQGERQGVEIEHRRYYKPSILECDCGTEIDLYDPMDNVCSSCGAIYNMSGQRVTCLSTQADEPYWPEDYY